MTDHPITPPPELMLQWRGKAPRYRREEWLIERAAQWGYDKRGEVNEAKLQKARDQELDACIEVIESGRWFANPVHRIVELRAARRPKPPSDKEQALEALNEADQGLNESEWRLRSNTIRRALEQLPDDQG